MWSPDFFRTLTTGFLRKIFQLRLLVHPLKSFLGLHFAFTGLSSVETRDAGSNHGTYVCSNLWQPPDTPYWYTENVLKLHVRADNPALNTNWPTCFIGLSLTVNTSTGARAAGLSTRQRVISDRSTAIVLKIKFLYELSEIGPDRSTDFPIKIKRIFLCPIAPRKYGWQQKHIWCRLFFVKIVLFVK